MKTAALAAAAAASTSSSVTSLQPAMLSRMVPEKRTGSLADAT